MTTYRCEWCGRFYSSALPEPSACLDHIPEHNARLEADIARFNAKLAARQASPNAAPVAKDGAAPLPDAAQLSRARRSSLP